MTTPNRNELSQARAVFTQLITQFASGLITVREFQSGIAAVKLPPVAVGEVDPATGLTVEEKDTKDPTSPGDGLGHYIHLDN